MVQSHNSKAAAWLFLAIFIRCTLPQFLYAQDPNGNTDWRNYYFFHGMYFLADGRYCEFDNEGGKKILLKGICVGRVSGGKLDFIADENVRLMQTTKQTYEGSADFSKLAKDEFIQKIVTVDSGTVKFENPGGTHYSNVLAVQGKLKNGRMVTIPLEFLREATREEREVIAANSKKMSTALTVVLVILGIIAVVAAIDFIAQGAKDVNKLKPPVIHLVKE